MAMDLNQTNFTQPLFRYIRQQRENKRFVDGVEVSITFFVIALFGFFAIRPTLLTISALIGENKAKADSIIAMKTKINNVVKAQDNFVKIQDDFPLIDQGLPDIPDYGDVASQIEGVALKTGLVLDKINYNLSQEGGVQEIPAKTDAFAIVSSSKNTFAVSNSFISGLLKNRRLLDFTVINFITPKQNEVGTDGKIEFSFTTNFLNFKKN